MRKPAAVVFFCSILLFLATLTFRAGPAVCAAANPDSRVAFAPVQGGFTSQPESVLPFAPSRILVKFAPEAMRQSHLDIGMARGTAVPDARTGLASIDAVCSEIAVTRISRPYIQLRNSRLAGDLGVERWYLLEWNTSANPMIIAERLAADPAVEAATPDWRAFPASAPNDPLYSSEWGHHNTAQMLSYCWGCGGHPGGTPVGTVGFDANAEQAWSAGQGYGSSAVTIAIIDSGVDIDHPDLRLVTGYDFGSNDSNPDDNSAAAGHGTACAGIAAAIANNGLGVAGIAGGCSIMPLKVANSAGTMYFSSIQNALYYAADHGADVASMSLGAGISSEPATDSAILYAHNSGVTILAATGNENFSTISYPAINPYVIGVGAASPCGERKRSSSNPAECNPGVYTDPNGYTCDGERWWGSNYGSTVQDSGGAVDVIAPTIMPTTDIGGSGGYEPGDYSMWFNGTSCATPYAAGVCGLIVSSHAGWSPDQVRSQLVSTAQDVVSVESGTGWDRYTGYGMVDAEAAVGGGTPPPPVAAFTGAPTSGELPLTVSFLDQSSNGPNAWSWTFGDGESSSQQNPVHIYQSAGVFTVALTVSNAYGSDTLTRTDYITVTEPGVTSQALALSDIPLAGNVTGSYQDTHVSDNSYEVITEVAYSNHPRKTYSYLDHKWNFSVTGGSEVTFHLEAYRPANSDGDDFAFFYSTDDVTYNTLLTVASATEQTYAASLPSGTSGTVFIRVMDTVHNWGTNSYDSIFIDQMFIETTGATPQPPVADFSGSPTVGFAPLAVSFSDGSLNGPTAWSWTFGDGGTSTQQNPGHTYQAAGTYTVSLTVSNAYGSDSLTRTDYITVSEQGSGTMHVHDLVVSRHVAGRNVSGVATITIFDSSDQPVANATVYADATGPVPGTFSGLTLADGTVTFETGKTKDPIGNWCFQVSDVTHASLTYNPAENVVTEACEAAGGGQNAQISGSASLPAEFDLAQNQPNPFNPATEIAFGLPQAGRVRLCVYNVKGELIVTLLDEHQEAGRHRVVWNAGDAASGVYFYRVDAGPFHATRRMILVK